MPRTPRISPPARTFALILLTASAPVAWAAEPTDPCEDTPLMEGCAVVNPVTGEEETIYMVPDPDTPVVITRVITGATSVFHAIWTSPPEVGMEFPDPDFIDDPQDENDAPRTLVVVEVLPSEDEDLADAGYFDRIVVRDLADEGDEENPPTTWQVALVDNVTEIYEPGAPAIVPAPLPETDPPNAGGNTNLVRDRRYGNNGQNGKDGGGLRICIIKCFTIGVDPTAGHAGDPGPTLTNNVANRDITSVSGQTPGVLVSSTGGNGGQGGDAYSVAGVDAAHGGPAGRGGNPTVNVADTVTITTTGNHSHGIHVQSIAGSGGAGGSGYALFSGSGGNGGPAAEGGNATATNHGEVTTTGAGAVGLYVQSLGGGGGSGGNGWGVVGDAGTASVGGHGGTANATNSGSIHTYGLAAHGVVAQSVGGNGGDGGRAGGIVAVGGSGSGGGNGGNASATNTASGSIRTENAHAYGMLVQSIGGGGGNGGTAVGIGAIGGGGQAGGTGAAVTATNAGDIVTQGAYSHGVVAQSIGGGGGTGAGGAGVLAIGGGGGQGGRGGTVQVNNAGTGTIATQGAGAAGILAQSIGGGGGAGGGAGGLVSIGGSGGGAGEGLAVTVNSAGSVTTLGVDGKGIIAQSIGGGGGFGASAGGAVSVGGTGGGGGNGGVVAVTNSGSITTWQQGGDAIIAQSIGGGGGDGGSVGGLVALGGTGGGGGSANTVSVTNSGDINTAGERARGVLAQSIGGGGGNGGNSAGLASIGGEGTVAGNAQVVTVHNTGSITTANAQSSAIEAQSIGGGGGSGGSSNSAAFSLGGSGGGGGNGNAVNVTNGGALRTSGADSAAILAQSIGGGGGNGGNSISAGVFASVAIGGDASGGGTGGNVNITLQGQDASTPSMIRTDGDRSAGILAQSVGGSGGNGGGSIATTIGLGAAASIGIGGNAGNGNTSGTVQLLAGSGQSQVETHGDDSAGVVLQSVGGSGGNGGYALTQAAATMGSLSVSVGGSGGSGAVGGNVVAGVFSGNDLTSAGFRGSISTEGERSTGLLAQSVGGGGGNGGFALSNAGSASAAMSGSLALGIGGNAGNGGVGGNVSVGFDGDISTRSAQSTGLLAQSVGGGGGNGGGTVNTSLAASGGVGAAVSVGIGGEGGTGGTGGTVRVATTSGAVSTRGENSSGIVLQSVGGGGGNGGYSINTAAGAGAGLGGALSLGLGGDAGAAGTGGLVHGRLASSVRTRGDNSSGVVAQSIGGGGGNGGFNVSGAFGAGGLGGAAVSVGLGGDGGAGGAAGNVDVIANGTSLVTEGNRSAAFIAQSIGGGGGNGGFNVSGSISGGGAGAGSVSVGLGGDGAGGGAGGNVLARVDSLVSTGFDALGNRVGGEDSTGILVQSVGGGGGNGGFNVSGGFSGGGGGAAAISVGLGGSGGTASNGGEVRATANGAIQTAGDRASGFVAQSIGGGGGNGGANVTGTLAAGGVGAGAINVGLGGAGGGGGDGGRVFAEKSGDILTLGDHSTGMVVQSIGGGGGNGGSTIDVALAGAGVGSGAIGVGIGGSGGDGGDAGVVKARTQAGTISTAGEGAGGIVLQSIGGGGGSGGYSVQVGAGVGGIGTGAINVGLGGSGGDGGDGEAVCASASAGLDCPTAVQAPVGAAGAGLQSNVQTRGHDATGILVQSVGGGGGNGGFSIVAGAGVGGIGSGAIGVGLGGSGGVGGAAGNVSASFSGTILTEGDRSSGFVVQSIGGGGGNGGFNVTGTLAGSGIGSGAVNVGLGGHGGGGGAVGWVDAQSYGDVTTTGNMSTGILAQSIGGGGGNGGFNVNVALNLSGVGGGAVNVGLGGNGASGADANTVDLLVQNHVSTAGRDSAAVVAQSIGGGGGNGGFNVTVAANGAGVGGGSASVGLGGQGAGGGDGRRVNAEMTGNILTQQGGSTGLLAQSVGGGGGNGGFNVAAALNVAGVGGGGAAVGLGGSGGDGGDGGVVDARITGNVSTAGERSAGVVAQSLGGGGGNGGLNVTGTITAAGVGSGGVAVGLGGSGGGGGDAMAASATVQGDVATGLPGLSGLDGDDAGGVLAQSLGGGGGNGALNVSGAMDLSGTGGGAVAVGLGGFGGDGGDAGAATAEVNGDVTTRGARSTAVAAQSIGGGGGNGGLNVSGTITAAGVGSGGVAVGLGGFGGGGGEAQTAEVRHTGNIGTLGADSAGVLAQSLGGGGGNGGINVTGAVNLSGTGGGALGVGIGGFGGDGGIARAASAQVTGNVGTSGRNANGVTVQSVGGGGGNGGINVTGVLAAAGSGSGAASVGIGGFGGGGGRAGTAAGVISGVVSTSGEGSHGVLLQSLGGGGGNGGINVSGMINLSGAAGGGAAIGVGGFGGSGGAGDAVSLTRDGLTTTAGNGASGIVAQSIGGGGGNGGLNVSGAISAAATSGGSAALGVGGFGGSGGVAGNAQAVVRATDDSPHVIATAGDDAAGLVVQSLGGGGGNGGINVSGAVSLSGSSGGSVALGLGGFGGVGGEGRWADAQVEGDISTQGANSHAVAVQSIGGGGGNGGINISGALTASQTTSGAVALGLGGFGGGGARAGAATGQVSGRIDTLGAESYGVLVQSLGGGGGNGGLNVSGALNLSTGTSVGASIGVGGFGGGGGDGDYIEFVRTGDTVTAGASAHGIVAQSVGGGGGNGGINVAAGLAGTSSGSAYSGALGIGGFGGSGGRGDNVGLSIFGDVLASGLESDEWVTDTEEGLTRRVRSGGSSGVLAQSVGGGGGNGGINVSGGIALSSSGGSGGSNALSLGLGGFGGAGGDAGMTVLDLSAAGGGTARVTAVGDGQFGVAAQSIGGGGGNGGINVSGGISMGGQVTLGVGGFGGAGGRGDAVRANVDADIRVSGANVVGFLAESIGGGGGNGGINISGGIQASTTNTQPRLVFGLGGFAGSGNTSGDVEATQHGDVHVDGSGSTGVLAQSIAGGGGNGGLNVAASVSGARRGIAAAIGIGGSGGDGADAGRVVLNSDGEIIVDGREHDGTLATLSDEELEALSLRERGNGILAQSIGGGGGNGGMNVSGVVAQGGNELAVGVGGSGGGGGNAGAVSVTRGANAASRIVTLGNQVAGLAAQSVGGGGGNAGVNIVFEASTQTTGAGSNQARLAVGGSGGTPGDGAAVDVDHTGDIITAGDSAHGLLAQSVGGGGGNANINFSKSLNRGGAKPRGASYSLAVGGGTGNGGEGGEVTVAHSGDIATAGNDATAIFAQSVGGGGGNAEADDSALGSFLDAADIAADALSDTRRSVDIEIGRSGGIGGDGGDVAVASNGRLTTEGDRAVGIRAQSVGAGGGVSGTTSASISANSEISLQVGVGGATGGRAGHVHVDAAGLIATQGDDAHAIHAQSVGGGGGEGGSVGGSLMPSGNSVSVGVGGAGGSGGVSGTVEVVNAAALSTQGDGAYGIHAQSIGGGGGDGGYAGITQDDAYGAAVDLVMGAVDGGLTEGGTQISALVGGNGGVGALADRVTIANTGTVLTAGREAHGINAQSIGGGGGVGGMVMNGTVTMGAGNNSLGINVGGQGGDGAQGADVSVTNDGVVWTQGDESVGIRAQSVGGGGGDAGLVAVLNVTPIPGSGQNAASLNIGGHGGTGSAAGHVSVSNGPKADGTGGVILTEGAGSHGIFAQSLGGGGGNGSSVLQLNFSTDVGGITAGLSVGGKGGDGAHSGDVTVSNAAHIETQGDGAHGVFAQSIGGGGGNGGMALAGNVALAAPGTSPLVTVGGEGGTGADAGDVTVTNSGSILTRGANAQGILAQSIGGGGGNAGMGIALSSDVGSVAAAGVLSALLGGKGGDGGRGGDVTVNHSGDITVFGDGSQAVVAESINGGGGSIALDFNGITSLPGGSGLPDWLEGAETAPVFEFSIGGTDKQGSTAGVVTLNYTGTFGVAGDHGAASRVQAIGGGGGTYTLNLGWADAGMAPGERASVRGALGGTRGADNAGGDIDSQHAGNLVTEGDHTLGLFAQSVGGGGGRANVNVDSASGEFGDSQFTLGGTGGSNETGGAITHAQHGSLATFGNAAHGALLQSIGGGGGLLDFALNVPAPSSPPASAAGKLGLRTLAAETPAAGLHLALGSHGGSGLHGGDVSLSLEGDVNTAGDHALGLVIQSIGAGGGISNVSGAEAITVHVGGSAGAQGDGGDVNIDNAGHIITTGAGSHAVLLQSIGGGGGAVLADASAAGTPTLSADNAGQGGAIRFTQKGDIRTDGAAAHAVLVQSLGGGGGFVDGGFAGSAGGAGSGGAIDLDFTGDVLALGEGSTALLAQSSGRDGGGDIDVTLQSGHSMLGGAGGSAVRFDGGAANRFTNQGTLATLDGPDGMVFVGGAGGDHIVNHGLVFGNVDLGGGSNAFTNATGATLYSGDTLSLGAPTNLLLNQGLLEPGAAGLAVQTSLEGSFRQAAGAVSNFELDFATDAFDSVAATGTAEVGGEANVSLLNVHRIQPGHFVRPLYSGAAGVTDNGLQFNPQQSIVIDYELVFSQTAAAMDYTVDFSAPGLQGNRVAIGRYFNGVQAAGSSDELADLITKFVLTTDLADYSRMLTQLGAEFYAEQQAYALASSQRFGRSLRNCGAQNLGRIAGDAPRCVWARLDLETTDRDAALGTPAGSEFLRRRSFGYQFQNEGGFSWGFGIDSSDTHIRSDDGNWSGRGGVIQAGGLLRRTVGDWSMGGVVMFGGSEHDIERRFNVTGPYDVQSRRSVGFATAVVDVARRIEAGPFTLTPGFGVGGTRMRGHGATEMGGPQSLRVVGHTDRHLWAEPSLNLGFQREVARGEFFRGYARFAALRYLHGATSEARATLQGAPAAAAPMRVHSDLDRTHWVAEGGLEFIALDRITLGATYSVQQSDLRENGSFALRFSIPFR